MYEQMYESKSVSRPFFVWPEYVSYQKCLLRFRPTITDSFRD